MYRDMGLAVAEMQHIIFLKRQGQISFQENELDHLSEIAEAKKRSVIALQQTYGTMGQTLPSEWGQAPLWRGH